MSAVHQSLVNCSHANAVIHCDEESRNLQDLKFSRLLLIKCIPGARMCCRELWGWQPPASISPPEEMPCGHIDDWFIFHLDVLFQTIVFLNRASQMVSEAVARAT